MSLKALPGPSPAHESSCVRHSRTARQASPAWWDSEQSPGAVLCLGPAECGESQLSRTAAQLEPWFPHLRKGRPHPPGGVKLLAGVVCKKHPINGAVIPRDTRDKCGSVTPSQSRLTLAREASGNWARPCLSSRPTSPWGHISAHHGQGRPPVHADPARHPPLQLSATRP